MFYLTTHLTHFIKVIWCLHMVKDHSDSERGNPLTSYGLLFPIRGMMHIKESLLLIGKNSPCGGSGFLHSLS